MTSIKPFVYENLMPRQRIIASIEALARGDEEERQRLIKTCPKKIYRQNDAAFVERIEALETMALAVECDLRGCALDYFLALKGMAVMEGTETEGKLSERFRKALQEMANIKAAWADILAQEGIDPDTMSKANLANHNAVAWLENITSDPEDAGRQEYRDILGRYLNSY